MGRISFPGLFLLSGNLYPEMYSPLKPDNPFPKDHFQRFRPEAGPVKKRTENRRSNPAKRLTNKLQYGYY